MQAIPGIGEIRVDPLKLQGLHIEFGDAAAAFVLAYGLGLALTPPTNSGLHAACNAGTLLAALPLAGIERQSLLA